MLFFGTVFESIQYFSSIGFRPPIHYTPTNYFLAVSDPNYGTEFDYDFEGSFTSSRFYIGVMKYIDSLKRYPWGKTSPKMSRDIVYRKSSSAQLGEISSVRSNSDIRSENVCSPDISYSSSKLPKGPGWKQFLTLLKRNFVIAARYPSLYYLQFSLSGGLGFVVGSTFLSLKYEIADNGQGPSAAILWLTLISIYIQILKIPHLSRSYQLFRHEHSNQHYSVLPYFLADLLSSALLLISVLPGVALGYFLIGFPSKGFLFTMLVSWLVRIAFACVRLYRVPLLCTDTRLSRQGFASMLTG